MLPIMSYEVLMICVIFLLHFFLFLHILIFFKYYYLWQIYIKIIKYVLHETDLSFNEDI